MEHQRRDPLLEMLKVLADESRLNLLRLLCEGKFTVGDLAERVGLTEPTVSHHLARLRAVGFLTLHMAGNQHFYRVNRAGLGEFQQLVEGIGQLRHPVAPIVSDDSWIDALGWPAEDQQVLRKHIVNGQLTHLPRKQKKLLVILRWLATLFQPDTMYTEGQVNSILFKAYDGDHVGLRRDLVDFGYLRREVGGGKYWLAPTEE